MGHKSCAALFMLIFLAALMSGCTQTGRIVNKTEASSTAQQPQQAAAEIYVNPAGQENESAPDAPEEPAVQASPANPCEGITCPDSVTLCDDGFKARCRNGCSNGACSICMPDCAGHGLCDRVACNDSVKACPGSGTASCKNTCSKGACSNCTPQCQAGQQPGGSQCELSCGACRDANYQKCSCDLIVPCSGNGICEQGEYPGADCQDCNDSSSCTEDLYNYTSGRCYHDVIAPCCGNGACENQTESHATCPSDCIEPPKGSIEISEIMYDPSSSQGSDSYNEWIELRNPSSVGVDVSNWTICGDIVLSGYVSHSDGKVYKDSGALIPAGGYAVVTDGGTGTDVFANFNVSSSSVALHVDAASMCSGLKNDNDTITLSYQNRSVADSVSYTKAWGAAGSGKTLIRNGTNWAESAQNGGTPGTANA